MQLLHHVKPPIFRLALSPNSAFIEAWQHLRKDTGTIVVQPKAGEIKVGDLAGVQVYKFCIGNLLCLLAYRVLDEKTLKLLMVGPHENFYRELKRTEH